MPKYINSKFLSGADFVVRDNGRIFKRTGTYVKRSTAEAARSSHQPNKSLVIEKHEIDTVLYNATCSGAAFGEQTIAPGSTLEVDSTNTDVQLRFTGTNPGDTGTLILSSSPGQTCTVTLSVNPGGNMVFDSESTGSGPHELTTYPSRFAYFDCLNNEYELVFARKGSFVTNLSRSNLPRPPAGPPNTRPPLVNPGQSPNSPPPPPPGYPSDTPATWDASKSLGLSGTQANNHSVDATWSIINNQTGYHHYHGGQPWGANNADIYVTSQGMHGDLEFTLSVIWSTSTDAAAFESETGGLICADCQALSAHSFKLYGSPVSGAFHDVVTGGSIPASSLGSNWVIPCAGCGGTGNELSVVLAVSGLDMPIDWTTGQDTASNHALYWISYTGRDHQWTLSKAAIH